ncbi:MAG: DMT family transporter [Deltaproteobacteria bacterium]|nr:DMT family transporter [Deltaproteobacteria bacterium]
MLSPVTRGNLLLLLASFIWGTAFVAQRMAVDVVQPMTFNGTRFALGALVLVPFAFWRHGKGKETPALFNASTGFFVIGALLAGMALFAGATLQQVGLQYTTAGKAGFITGLYVVLVPILGLCIGYRPSIGEFFGAAVACAGLYLLSMQGGLSIAIGDAYVLAGTLFWATHVLLLAWLSPKLDCVRLALAQFVVCAALNLVGAVLFETITMEGLKIAAMPILYGGILSVGVAYTLQVVAQKDAPPTHAAVILSLETVFAALAGWVILNETMSGRGIIGAVLMLSGMLLAQIGPGKKAQNPGTETARIG